MWLDNLKTLVNGAEDAGNDDPPPRAGPVKISHATPEQMAIWAKEREALMKKRAAIIEDYRAGMSRSKIAEKHGLALNTVNYHIRNAKLAAEAERKKDASCGQSPHTEPEAERAETPAHSAAQSAVHSAAQSTPVTSEPNNTQSMYAISPVPPPFMQRKSTLRPTAYTGDYAVYSIREGCVIMDDLPSADLDMFSAEQLRAFAAELIELAAVIDGMSA